MEKILNLMYGICLFILFCRLFQNKKWMERIVSNRHIKFSMENYFLIFLCTNLQMMYINRNDIGYVITIALIFLCYYSDVEGAKWKK